MDSVAAIILAGGKSSRMGSDKAALMLHEKKLIDHIAAVIGEAGVEKIYVSGEVDGYDSIPDIIDGQPGPVAGICSVIAKLRNEYRRLVFIPVDMPLITPSVIKLLLDGVTHSYACYFEERPLPFAISLSEMTLGHSASIMRNMSEGMQFSVRKYLEAFHPFQIKYGRELELALTNTNTPEEWIKATHEPENQ